MPILILASTFYTAALEKPFEQALATHGRAHTVVCVPYNQLQTFLLNPRSVVPENSDASVLLLLRVEDLIRLELAELGKGTASDLSSFLRVFREREVQFLDILSRISQLRLTAMVCPSGRGAYSVALLGNATRIAEHKIAAELRGQQSHLVLSWPEFERAKPGNWFSASGDRLGHVPFSPEGLNALADFFVEQLERMPSLHSESFSASTDALGLGQFLATLEVEVSITPLTEEDEQPAINLIRHTTHFINLVGGKWDAGFLQALANGIPGAESWVVRVRDRFGDYGISGAVIFGFDGGNMRAEFLFLTCPVLGRQVEYALMDWMAQMAERRRAAAIDIPFVQGRDNQGLCTLLARLEETPAAAAPSFPPGTSKRFLLRVPGLTDRIAREAPNAAALSAILSKMSQVETTQ